MFRYHLFVDLHILGEKSFDFMNLIFPLFCTLEYPLVSIEQPFDKDDWEHSKKFTTLELCQVPIVLLFSTLLSGAHAIMHLQVVGDDLLMSDPERIKRAVNEYTCDALTLKVSHKSFICLLMFINLLLCASYWDRRRLTIPQTLELGIFKLEQATIQFE